MLNRAPWDTRPNPCADILSTKIQLRERETKKKEKKREKKTDHNQNVCSM